MHTEAPRSAQGDEQVPRHAAPLPASGTGARALGALALAAVCLLIVAYLLVWQRGYYSDDYAHRNWAVDVTSGAHRPWWALVVGERLPGSQTPVRLFTCIAIFEYVAHIPEHEWAARALAAAATGLNALLLGALLYRLLGSRLAAAIAALLYLAPVLAYEAVLWASACGYILGTGCALVYLHAAWSALQPARRLAPWLALAAVAFGALLLFNETLAVAAGFVVFLAALRMVGATAAVRRRVLGRAGLILLTSLGLAALAYLFLYTGSVAIPSRGGLVLSADGLLRRIEELRLSAAWFLALNDWGTAAEAQALRNGLASVVGNPPGVAALALGGLALVAGALTFRERAPGVGRGVWPGLLALSLGAVWAVLPLFVPAALLAGQGVAPRMFYFPAAGLALALGALGALLSRLVRGVALPRLLLLLAGLAATTSAVMMCGLAGAYDARNALDQRQLAALTAQLPGAHLPPDAYILPYRFAEALPGEAAPLSELVQGVFEAPWAVAGALQAHYGRPDVHALTGNRWAPMRLAPGDDPTVLVVQSVASPEGQGVALPAAQVVLFVERDGEVFLADGVRFLQADGREERVALPVGQALGQEGVPTTTLEITEGS